MWRSSRRLWINPARRRSARWCESVGAGMPTASWMSPALTSRLAWARKKNTRRRDTWASALNASTCSSVTSTGLARSTTGNDAFMIFKIPNRRQFVNPPDGPGSGSGRDRRGQERVGDAERVDQVSSHGVDLAAQLTDQPDHDLGPGGCQEA